MFLELFDDDARRIWELKIPKATALQETFTMKISKEGFQEEEEFETKFSLFFTSGHLWLGPKGLLHQCSANRKLSFFPKTEQELQGLQSLSKSGGKPDQ